jgi:hypothetical protein
MPPIKSNSWNSALGPAVLIALLLAFLTMQRNNPYIQRAVNYHGYVRYVCTLQGSGQIPDGPTPLTSGPYRAATMLGITIPTYKREGVSSGEAAERDALAEQTVNSFCSAHHANR